MNCPACDGDRGRARPAGRLPSRECLACGLVYLDPPPSNPETYGDAYYEHWFGSAAFDAVYRMKLLGCRRALRVLLPTGGRLLDVGCAHGYMLDAARERGFRPEGVEISPAAEHARRNGYPVVATLDGVAPGLAAATLMDVIEHLERPREFLEKIGRLLEPGGRVLLATPDLGSAAASLLGPRWPHYKPEHVTYFTAGSLSALLTRAGFRVEWIGRQFKILRPSYIRDHFARYSGASALTLALRCVPDLMLPFPSGMMVRARRC